MSTSIDNRIVEMRFNNAQFESGVKTSLNTLDRLKAGLNLEESKKSLAAVSNAASQVNLSNLEDGVNRIGNAFSMMGTIATTVLSNITTSAMGVGRKLISSIVNPIVQGGIRRAENIEMAKFQIEGLGHTWDEVKDSINTAVDGTAYGLDVAARAASQFLATGVATGDDMTTALRAISGAAAMTGAEYETVADIFIDAAGAGRVMNGELGRLSERGINAAATMAQYYQTAGTYTDEFSAKVNELGKKGKLSISGMDEISQIATGDIRALASAGVISFNEFAKAMDDAFGEHATKANETFSGALSNVKAALARIGADVATPQLENFRDVLNAIRPVINDTRTALQPLISMLNTSIRRRTDGLVHFFTQMHLLGGVNPLLKTFTNLLTPLYQAGAVIRGVFREVFPQRSVSDLVAFLNKMQEATAKFHLTGEAIDKLQRAFKGLFSLFHIIGMGIKAILPIFKPIGSLIVMAAKGIGTLAANIGDVFTKWDEKLRSIENFGQGIQKFVDKIQGTINKLKELREARKQNLEKLGDKIGLKPILSELTFFQQMADGMKTTFNTLHDAFSKLFKGQEKAAGGLSSLIKKISDGLANAARVVNEKLIEVFNTKGISGVLDLVFKLINEGLVLALLGGLNRIVAGFQGLGKEVKNVVESFNFKNMVSDVFGGVTDTLKTFQQSIKAKTILRIAGAIAVLAAALIAVSFVNTDKLASSLGAVSALFGELMVMMFVMDKLTMVDKKSKTIKFQGLNKMISALLIMSISVTILASALVKVGNLEWSEVARGILAIGGLMTAMVWVSNNMKTVGREDKIVKVAAALLVYTFAIKKLSDIVVELGALDTDDLIKGLAGVMAILLELVAFMKLVNLGGEGQAFAKFSESMGLDAVAAAISLIAQSVEKLGNLNPEQLAKGLVGVGAILAELAVFSKFVSKNGKGMLAAGTSLILIGAALNIISKAMSAIGDFKWEQIGKSLAGIGGLLAEIIVFSHLVGGGGKMLAMGASLLMISTSLVIFAQSMGKLSGMSWEGLAKGLVAIAGALTVMIVAMQLARGAIGGAIALGIMSLAIMGIAPAIALLGALPLKAVGIALLALAGAFGVIVVAAYALTPIAPIVMALSAAFLLFGIAVGSIGGGVLALAKGFAILAGLSFANLMTVSTALMTIADLIPYFAKKVGEGIIAILQTIADSHVALLEAFTSIGMAFIEAIEQLVPQLATLGLTLITAVIRAIADNIGQIAQAGHDLVMNFIGAMNEKRAELDEACAQFIINTINGMAENIRTYAPELVAAIQNLMSSVVEALLTVLQALVENIPLIGPKISEHIDTIKQDMADRFGGNEIYEIGAKVPEDVAQGITDNTPTAQTASTGLMDTIGTSLLQSDMLGGIGMTDGSSFVDGFDAEAILAGDSADSISTDILENLDVSAEAKSTGSDITSGFNSGLSSNSSSASTTVKSIASDIIKGFGSNKTKAKTEGTSYGTNYNSGLNSSKGKIKTSATGLATSATSAIKGKVGQFKTEGSNAGSGFAQAMANKSNAAYNAGDKLGDRGASGAKNYSGFYNSGTHDVSGLTSGLYSGTGAAYKAGYALGKAAEAGKKAATGDNSPSKQFIKSGRHDVEGLVIGLTKYSRLAYRAAFKLGYGTIDSMRYALQRADSIINSDMELVPTITPVIDMSNVKNGAKQIGSIMNSQRTLSMSASISGNVAADIQNRNNLQNSLANLSNRLDSVTDSMNSRQMINYITVDGAENPEAFADRFVRKLKLNMRTV